MSHSDMLLLRMAPGFMTDLEGDRVEAFFKQTPLRNSRREVLVLMEQC